jgi:hypothetical protein
MALVIATDGKKVHVTAAQGDRLWRLKTGLEVPRAAAEAKVVERTKRVYLSRHTAPTIYIEKNLDLLLPMLLSDWLVDRQGRYVKPEEHAWETARRYKLWEHGRIGNIVQNAQRTLL